MSPWTQTFSRSGQKTADWEMCLCERVCVWGTKSRMIWGVREMCVCVCRRLPERARLHSGPGFAFNMQSCAGRSRRDALARSVSYRFSWQRCFPSFFWKNAAHWPSCSGEVKNKLASYQKLVWTCQTEAQRARRSTSSNWFVSNFFFFFFTSVMFTLL